MTLPEGLVSCEDGLVRPTGAATDLLLRDYYDTEWGRLVTSEPGVLERSSRNDKPSGLPSHPSFPRPSLPSPIKTASA